MRVFNTLLIALALIVPALAVEMPAPAVRAITAAVALDHAIEGTNAAGGLLDCTQPPVSGLFRQAFDVDALAALPPPEAGDVSLLLTWSFGVDKIRKSILARGVRPGSDRSGAATARNLKLSEDQFAAAADFIIRLNARTATAYRLFLDGLGAQQYHSIRAAHTARAKANAAAMIEDFLASWGDDAQPDNARRVTGALRDTADVWAGFIAPDARKPILDLAAQATQRITDEEARRNLASFSVALAAAK